MATANTEETENQLSDQIVQFLSQANEGVPITNQELKETLGIVLEQLQDMNVRKKLAEYLRDINLSIGRVESLKSELQTSAISIANVGDYMVSLQRNVKSSKYLRKKYYSEASIGSAVGVNTENKNANTENQNANTENQNMNAENQNMNAENQNMNAEKKIANTENQNANTENQNMNAENQNMNTENQNMNAENQNMNAENKKMNTENQNMNIKDQNENAKNDQAEEKIQFEMDRMCLSEEPEFCLEILNKLRDLIHRSLVLHTELFLMGNELKNYIENLELIKMDIPIFPGSEYTREQTRFMEVLRRNSSVSGARVGLVLGGVCGLISGAAMTGCMLAFIKCGVCGHAIWKGIAFGCVSCGYACTGACIPPLVIGLSVALLGGALGILADWAWNVGSDRREVFENLHKFRRKIEESEIESHLTTLLDQLEARMEGVKNTLNGRDNPISVSQFNVIVKAYKKYRQNFEDTKKSSLFQDKADGEVHQIVRIVSGSIITDPLLKSFDNLTPDDCWTVIDSIHKIVMEREED